jgi:hypothetical protein
MEFVTAMTFLFVTMSAPSLGYSEYYELCSWGYNSRIVSLNSHFYLIPRLRIVSCGVVCKYRCLPFMNWPFAIHKHIQVELFESLSSEHMCITVE